MNAGTRMNHWQPRDIPMHRSARGDGGGVGTRGAGTPAVQGEEKRELASVVVPAYRQFRFGLVKTPTNLLGERPCFA